MSFPITSRSLRILLLITFLIGCAGLVPRSGRTSTHSTGKSPIRLRLKVENNTLRSGQATKISVEFLDGDYQQVPNDGTRVVEFGIALLKGQPSGSGAISPQQVTVKTGAWSADTTFASGQPGRVVITARTDGLDSDQTILVVTRAAPSMLSQLFDTVAYAQRPDDGFGIWPPKLEKEANNKSRATFLVSFLEPPPANTTIRISVSAPAAIVYDGQNLGAMTDIKLPEGKSRSGNIDIISGTAATVDIRAAVLPAGPETHAAATFTKPHPSRIAFDDNLRDISSQDKAVPILLQLTDDIGNPLESDQERSITLRRANEDDPVEFEPPSVVFSPNQRFAESILHLKGLPWGNELTVLAVPSDSKLQTGRKTITIRSAIEKIMVTGPSEVRRGNTNAEFTIHLADKNGKSRTADWDRKINLSVSSGTLSQTQVTIPKGQDAATVKYAPPDATGKVVLRAESRGAEGSLEIVLVTALYWLVIAALLGGLFGGVVRHVLKDYKLERVLPQRVGQFWELGLVGRILGSIASGLFLYLTIKFGLARLVGLSELPAALDLGTKLAAFFFGGIGGFAGTIVFDRLASFLAAGAPKEKVQTQPVT